jgi:hypothetical protein
MNDPVKKGAWIASTKKHLDRHQCTPEVYQFPATDVAGKAANLLSLLQADSQERVTAAALNTYFVTAKIRPAEQEFILQKLQADGRLEICRTSAGVLEGVDVYTFSREQVLRSAARIFDGSNPTAREIGSIDGLEFILALPRSESELVVHLTAEGFRDDDARLTVQLQQTLGLVGVDCYPGLDEPIVYNEHAFVAPGKIVAAYRGLNARERQSLQDVQHAIEQSGCVPFDAIVGRFPEDTLTMMEGLGLIDRQEVVSQFGNSDFITLPQTFGVYGGQLGMGVDCFHHAKMLLCCLKYGQMKSMASRGKITEPRWILDALLRGSEVGPCTAIGQDYTILENEGVISVRRACGREGEQYFMRLRKKEVAELAKQVLLYNRTIADAGLPGVPVSSAAGDYVNPQVKRADIIAAPTGPVAEVRAKLLTTLRT